MAKIKTLKEEQIVKGTSTEEVYPRTLAMAVHTESNTTVQEELNNLKKDKANVKDLQEAITELEENRVLVEGDIINMPDEEDLTTVNNKLQFKDRIPNPDKFISRGYKILRPNPQQVNKYNLKITTKAAKNGNITVNGTIIAITTTMDTNAIEKAIQATQTNVGWDDTKGVTDFNASPTVDYGETGVTGRIDTVQKTINLLTQDVINEPNTNYICNYDITLNKDLNFGKNSTLNLNGNIIDFNNYTINRNIVIKNAKIKNYKYYITNVNTLENCYFDDETKISLQGNVSIKFNIDSTLLKNGKPLYNLFRYCFNDLLEELYKHPYTENTGWYKIIIPNYTNGIFYIDRPIIIKNRYEIDFNNISIIPTDDYSYDSCIIYESNTVYANIVESEIKNLAINIANNIYPNIKKVVDCTNFGGKCSNISINLGKNNTYGFYQPIGTPYSSYSDRKILRRIEVTHDSSTIESKSKIINIFAFGDGNIFEQCILGNTLIIGGRATIINGNLNDIWNFYNTITTFNGCYYEVGQFNILNSKVTFSNCLLTADNVITDNNRNYKGDFIAIDNNQAKDIILPILKEMNYNISSITGKYSVVYFENNFWQYTTWGLSNKNSGNVIDANENSIIHGLEEQNSSYLDKYASSNNTPIIKGNFIDNIEYKIDNPTFLIENINNAFSNGNDYEILGIDWTEEECSKDINIGLYICLSKKRKLYYRVHKGVYHNVTNKILNQAIINNNKLPLYGVFTTMIDNEKYVVSIHNKCSYKSISENIIDTKFDNTSVNNELLKSAIDKYKYHNAGNLYIEDAEYYDMLDNSQFNRCTHKYGFDKDKITAWCDSIPQYGIWTVGDKVIVGNNTYIYNGKDWTNEDGTLPSKVNII